jgi:protease PrsW
VIEEIIYFFNHLKVVPVFFSLGILLIWMVYFFRIDFFEKEKIFLVIITTIAGMMVTFLAFPIYRYFNHNLNFHIQGDIVNDFLYCTFGIGLIEETVKLLPFLILLIFTRVLNEPYDYILYCILPALGFAFIENILYFSRGDLLAIQGRALISTVSHMFDTSIVGYGLVLSRYRYKINQFLFFIPFFLLAIIAHGFFDFWLICDQVKDLALITFIYYFLSIIIFNTMINNCLNHSTFFDKRKHFDYRMMQKYLILSLGGLLLLQYILVFITYDFEDANINVIENVRFGGWIVIFLSTSFSGLRIIKGLWEPFSLNINLGTKKMNFNSIEASVGEKIQLDIFTRNNLTRKYLPNSGKVVSTLFISKNPNFYLVELENAVSEDKYVNHHVIICPKEEDEYLTKGVRILIGLYLLPDMEVLNQDEITKKNLIFLGWASAY